MDFQGTDPSESHITEPETTHQPGLSYSTSEIDSMFQNIEDRLTGYAESLLGVARCLDSLQSQISDLKKKGVSA